MNVLAAIVMTALYFVIGALLARAFTSDPNHRITATILWPVVVAMIIILLPIFTGMELYIRLRDGRKK